MVHHAVKSTWFPPINHPNKHFLTLKRGVKICLQLSTTMATMTETPTAVHSTFRTQMYHLYIWWDALKCRGQLIVSTRCLVDTLSPWWRMSRRFVNDVWNQMSPPRPHRLTGKRNIFCHSSQQRVEITGKNTFLLQNGTDASKPEIKTLCHVTRDKAMIIQHVRSYGLADGWSCQMLLRRRSD